MPNRECKVRAALEAITAVAHPVFLRKWRHLLGILRSITLAISGAHGMFKCLHHALHQARGKQVLLSMAVYDDLSAWRQLVQELANRPMHLCEIDHPPPT